MSQVRINHICNGAGKWQSSEVVGWTKRDLCKGVPGEACSSYDNIKEERGWLGGPVSVSNQNEQTTSRMAFRVSKGFANGARRVLRIFVGNNGCAKCMSLG